MNIRFKKLSFIIAVFFVFTAMPHVLESQPIEEKDDVFYGLLKITERISIENVEKIVKKIMEFAENPNIKGVLLVINSGGGQTGTSEFVLREVRELAQIKPVVALVVNSCCSGAYLVAAGSHWIIAPAAATLGSIGVFRKIERYKNSHINSDGYSADVEYEFVYAGKFKVYDHPELGRMNEEERQFTQADVDDTYKIFYRSIAEQRNLSLENITEWADGKIFTGEKALELGLIDQIGGFSDAVRKLHELMKNNGVRVTGRLAFLE